MNATHKPVAEPATGTAVPARAPLPQNLPGRAVDSAEILRPSIGRPATTLADRNVTAVEPARAVSTTGQAAVASAEAPLEAFAAAHDAASGLPLLSFVLVDTGQSDMRAGLGLDTLAGFPYPVTIAVDASLPDAADRARAYRAQGFEVMAVVDVPENLTAADTEVALSVALTKVPGAIGIFEGTRAGLQGNSDISNQIRDILSDTGHGIVWQPNGLDAAQKQAAQAGVASQTLSRDLVDADLSPGQMRRVLDRAVFRAGQEGAVIMAGKAEAATVAALRDWARERRAERIAVAPVSAVLRAGQVPREG